MSERLSFSVDKYDIEEINDSQLSILRMWVCHDGLNLNDSYFSLDTIKSCENTFLKKPIVYKYSTITKDFQEHEIDEVPCGYIPELNNNLHYEELDEKTYLVIDAIIWKYYAINVIDVFERDQTKSISFEIEIIDSEKNDEGILIIKKFAVLSVCLLGSLYNPGMINAKSEIIKFSKDNIDELIAEIDKVFQKFALNNNKEVVDKNKEPTINNANIDTTKFKEGDDNLSFSKEEFAKQFSVTANQVKDMMNEICSGKKYTNGDCEYEKYWVRDFDASYTYAYDYELGHCVAIPYSVNEGKIEMDFENTKRATAITQWVISDEDNEDETALFVNKIIKDKEEKYSQQIETVKQQFETEKQEFTAKINDLENEKTQFSEKITSLEQEKEEITTKFSTLETENEELKTFKVNIEEQEKQNKIEFAIQSVSDDLTEDQVTEWRGKVTEFGNIDEFSNAIKAFAFSIVKQKQDPGKTEFSRIHIPTNTNDNIKSSLWERL